MKRKIAAILVADAVGYSRMVAEDEEDTLARLVSYRTVFRDFVAHFGGRIFDIAGDAILVEFESAVDAVRCAVDLQESLRVRNLAYPTSRKLSFRIGITIGDVVERDGDLLGDGVNVAARLESLAPVGGVCISRSVYEAVASKVSVKFSDRGQQHLKNIPEPVHAYTFVLGDESSGPQEPSHVGSLVGRYGGVFPAVLVIVEAIRGSMFRWRYFFLAGAVMLAIAVILAPYGQEITTHWTRDGTITIQGKKFMESSILVELMAILIEEEGGGDIEVDRKHWGGENQLLFKNLLLGDADLMPDYSGTLLVQYLLVDYTRAKSGDHGDHHWIRSLLKQSEHGHLLEWLDGFGFRNNYAIVMLRSRAEELRLQSKGIRVIPAPPTMPTISDLGRIASHWARGGNRLTLGIEDTFSESDRLDGYVGLLRAYPGLEDLRKVSVEHEQKFEQLQSGAIDVTNAYTTDPELADEDSPYVILSDDAHFFMDYYAAPLARRAVIRAYPELKRAMARLTGAISADDMRSWIRVVDESGIDSAKIGFSAHLQARLTNLCRDFLKQKGLLGSTEVTKIK